MSINGKLALGCFVFACMVAALGWLNYSAELEARALVDRGYAPVQEGLAALTDARRRAGGLDQALRLQTSEAGDKAPDATLARDEVRAALSAILLDLRLAEGKAASEEARLAFEELKSHLQPLGAAKGDISQRKLLKEMTAADEAFDQALALFQADAARVSRQLLARSESDFWRDLAGLAFCVSAVVLLCVWISRLVVSRMRHAAYIAHTLAEGDLKIAIPPQKTQDFEALFSALRDVRTSIASTTAQQAKRLLVQAHSFDHTIEAHQHRFVAALNNMTQGLCMLDANLSIIVFNEPFSKIFPHFKLGATSEDVISDPRFSRFLAPHETGTFVHDMPDGSMLQVKRRGVHGGGLVITFENITEQYRTSQRLEHLAGHDGLTDLPNRRVFREHLQTLLNDQTRLGDAAVFCLDLNGFKTVNDTFGHPIGDALLKAVSERLTACLAGAGLVARLGGDEFAILQTQGTQPEAAEALAAGIVSALSRPFDLDGRRIEIGVSIGITVVGEIGPRDVLSPDILMQNCDLALYQAKAEGRSAFRLYRPALREQLRMRREMELDLRLALHRGEFELFYQPFVDSSRRSISGFEALLRWRHPTKGLVSPGLFIPIAEELGLIVDIGRWVLREACAQAARWPERLTISVNLSPVQFRDRRLVDEVAEALVLSGLSPERLQLEVTESLFLDKTDDILSILTALRSRGSLISMDDFGTGYSSLGYLTRFPFDKIKIDQSFVRDIGKPESMAVIRAVIGLSRSMKMAVIAEGIESAEQFELLRAEGCREMQGYLFSRPRPASDLPKLLMEVSQRWDELTSVAPVREETRTDAA